MKRMNEEKERKNKKRKKENIIDFILEVFAAVTVDNLGRLLTISCKNFQITMFKLRK